MRTKFFTLVALLVAGVVQADVVVIENAGVSGSSTAGGNFDISWTQTTSAKLSSFKLFGHTGSDYEVQFNLFGYSDPGRNTLVRFDNVFITGTNDSNDFSFASTAISNTSLGAGYYLLRIIGLESGYFYNSNSNGTTPGDYGFSSATQTAVTGSEYLTYQLSAVPEPGTMLLGGIAAACGGAGAWWKRRKRPVLLAENPAIH